MYDNLIADHIAEHGTSTPITDISEIGPTTHVEGLNLNWREQDLPERIRTKHVHRLHPYLGKFIPQLAEIFLRKFQPQLVYDPFCGSGTTLVEAKALGIDSIGTDIAAFNVLISRAKTQNYDMPLLEREIGDILFNFSMSDHPVGELDNPYLQTWFSKQARHELFRYLTLIKNYTYQDLFKVILSRAARSARLVTHFDLDFPKKPQTIPYECYKHSRVCQPVQEARRFLIRYSMDTFKRVREFHQLAPCGTAEIHHEDARHVSLPYGIDMVFTSPPYLGLIDYHEQHRYSYEWLGLKIQAEQEIGSAQRGSSNGARHAYIDGINEVLSHTRRHMAHRGIMCIVVHDKFNLYDPGKVGFKAIGRVERHVNRRTGRRNHAFHESILIWEKR